MPTTADKLRAMAANSTESQRQLFLENQISGTNREILRAAERGKMSKDFHIYEPQWVQFAQDLFIHIRNEFPGVRITHPDPSRGYFTVSWELTQSPDEA